MKVRILVQKHGTHDQKTHGRREASPPRGGYMTGRDVIQEYQNLPLEKRREMELEDTELALSRATDASDRVRLEIQRNVNKKDLADAQFDSVFSKLKKLSPRIEEYRQQYYDRFVGLDEVGRDEFLKIMRNFTKNI